MSAKIQMSRELAKSLLNSVEYLAMRADDIGTSNVPVADELRALLAEHPLITCLHDNGDLIALKATVTHQAQMIEHLRGGLAPAYTTIDIANADADGFKNGFATAMKSLPEQQHFTNWTAYTEWRAAQIEALGDYGAAVKL
jgi:hypothetical protein